MFGVMCGVACGATAPARSMPVATKPVSSAAPVSVSPVPPSVSMDAYEIEERFMDPERVTKLETAFPKIDAAVSRVQKDLKIPGVAVAIVIDGKVAHVATAGYQDEAAQLPVTSDTVFRIGSVTKTMTAAAILSLRDAGKLGLDEPATKYLPELKKVQYPSRDSRPITLRHLLTHSAGLARDLNGGAVHPLRKGVTSAELSGVLDGMPLAFAPGSRNLYSNLGFALLGVVVERVAKVSYRDYLTKHFFQPLAMSSAAWERGKVPSARLAVSYEPKDGALSRVPEHEQLGIGEASGGLYLSTADLGRWIGWQLSAYPPRNAKESGPLSRASVREMHDATGGVQVRVGSPAFSTLESWVAEPWAGGWTLGWNRTGLCDFEQLVEKNGLVDYYHAEVGFFPNEGVGLVVLANTGFVNKLKVRAFYDVLKLLRETGGLARRVRIAHKARALDRALERFLAIMSSWDERGYQAMLTEGHKSRVPMDKEKKELEGYTALHGRCRAGSMVRFDSPEQVRYRLECERGHLELELSVLDGLIAGFTGYSTDVEPEPKAFATAQAALSKRKPRTCKLGKFKERDGFGWHRFELTCERGRASVLALQLDDAGEPKLDTIQIDPPPKGCAALAAR
jgi:CubicO group peptidase (beta-lactamase class C family)